MNKNDNDAHVRIVKLFDAPVERVFDAWTDPHQLVEWYAPENCSIVLKSLDVMEGGTFLYCISNPIFGDCWCKGTFLKIIRHQLLSYSVIVSDEFGNDVLPEDAGMDAEWPMESIVTVRFAENQGKTKIELTQSVSTRVAKKTGAYPSWLEMLEKLKSKTETEIKMY